MFLRIAKHQRIIASFLLVNFLTLFIPIQSKALSSGPSQPETEQFAPAGMDDMVNPFTGDFSYNIPLMDVGGYPINMSYASGITPDAEASWTGLGWNLNVGAINRSVRGLPDDFAGDPMVTDYNVAPNETYGATSSAGLSVFGSKFINVNVNANLFYNTYNGMGITLGVDPSISSSKGVAGGYTANLGIGLEIGSESGTDITPSIGVSHVEQKNMNQQGLNASVGFPFNTREGLKGVSISAGYVPRKSGSTILNTSTFIGFSTPTYTPSIAQSHRNTSFSLGASFNVPNPVLELGNLGFSGYYTGQFVANPTLTTPAFGYMYSGLIDSDNKLFDFNREKDGVYHKKYTQNLPLTNFTYDVFNVSGQGISGTYRLHRGDVGTVSDNGASDFSSNAAASISFGTIVETTNVGIGVNASVTNANSGKWTSDDNFIPTFNSEVDNIVPTSEKVYFKKIGESIVENDDNFLNKVQGSTDLLQYELQSDILGSPSNIYKNGKAVAVNPPGVSPPPNARSQRPNKASTFTTLSAAEALTGNILPIQNYSMDNSFGWQVNGSGTNGLNTSNATYDYTSTVIPRNSGARKNHHISEVRVTEGSGSRYIYGIPVYNNSQQEITFAAQSWDNKGASHAASVNSGLVAYKSTDISAGNQNGIDNYYNCVSTPGNAHSYLLTCILSSDYVDSDNIKGPSDGDLGTYTKFNYRKMTDNYVWRTPMSATKGIASFSDGMTGTAEDDKANVIWGTKEIWYLHSIETPTHVAEFHVSARLDGFGAEDREGGIGNVALQKLDKIVLYSKADKFNSSPESVKTVYFSYDYSLCPNTTNSIQDASLNPNQGKLTLKKVWFTYGNSKKGVLNPYVFTYADQNFDGAMDTDANGKFTLNPDYSSLNYDRWGYFNASNFLINSNGTTSVNEFIQTSANNPAYPNSYFPYTPQGNKSVADANAAVYALSTIQTPTGGTMHVVYESDDYAYVQDKQAMRMFSISNNSYNNGLLYAPGPRDPNNPNVSPSDYYVDIDLGEGFVPTNPLDLPATTQEFQKLYIGDIDKMFFKINMNVVSQQSRWEYVPGYAEIDKTNCYLPYSTVEGKYKQARIALKAVSSGPHDVSPIARAGWMYAKINLSRELKGLKDASNGVESLMYALVSEVDQIMTITSSFTGHMIDQRNSSTIAPGSSVVRLLEPDQIKFGGGHRVKAIVMSDHWALMKSSKESGSTPLKETSLYGQSYTYTTTNTAGVTISSGVAAYEPIMGGEENPFRQPVFVVEKAPLASNTVYFLDEPFGECFFPAPSVGYSNVITTPLKLTSYDDVIKRNFNHNGTGYVQQEFYTAKDFPTYTDRTPINKSSHNPSLISKFLKVGSTDLVECTQGYYIENNDMHGKPKAKRVFPETFGNTSTLTPAAISEVEYYYKTTLSNTTRRTTLDNTVTTVNPDLSINVTPSTMGVDVDMVNDEREFASQTSGGGVLFNTKEIEIVFIPLVIPIPWPSVTSEYVQFRSLVTTKVVNKYGILEKTIAKDNGAAITTTNMAWDGKTGEVLLSSIQNEYNDPIYTFNYPAHWAYPRMKHASSSEGLSFSKGYLSTQLALPVSVAFDPVNPFSNSSSQSIFNDGDELLLDNGVVVYLNINSMQWDLLDVSGKSHLTDAYNNAKVIRSGARNMPTAAIGTIVMKTNPMQNGTIVFSNVLNTGASEYSETWKRMGCDCANASTSTNPYILGLKGNLRPLRSWTYLTDRYQKLVNNNMALRTDGYFKDFSPFWVYNGATGLNDNSKVVSNNATTKWQYVTQITNYNIMGMEIENKDALGRYMMAQYGYRRKLPVATSNNSQYKESGFDGFEDYDWHSKGDCIDDHLSWRNAYQNVTNKESHTGRQSILVPAGKTLPITKVIENCQ